MSLFCAAALARLGIGRVFYGCKNEIFGSCGSLMHMHHASTLQNSSVGGYPVITGICENEAIGLLRQFYNRENLLAPPGKKRKKTLRRH